LSFSVYFSTPFFVAPIIAPVKSFLYSAVIVLPGPDLSSGSATFGLSLGSVI